MKENKSNNDKSTAKKELNVLPATEVGEKISDVRKSDPEEQHNHANSKGKKKNGSGRS